MNTQNCPNCKASSAFLFHAIDINRNISNNIFNYYRCIDCGLIFLSPIPKNLTDYYPDEYYVIPESLEILAIGAEAERYKIEIVEDYIKNGRLLEIGPATGGFSYLAKQSGFDVEVIEMNERCCEFLDNIVGVKAHHSQDESAALAKVEPVDVVTLWHVIEHLVDPWSMLEMAAEKLIPGGFLIISAPNPFSLQFRILKKHWTHLDAPRHVNLIPQSLLSDKMRGLGLVTVLKTTTDKGSIGWNGFGWEYSFSNKFKGKIAKRLARIAGKIVTGIFYPIEKVDGNGSAYTMIFKKEEL